MLSVIILTYNEEQHIARAIASVRAIASRIIVVDSYSTDRTVEISRELGAEVLQNPFINQAKQFQWGLDQAAIGEGWILRLDADEVVLPELAAEIAERLPTLGPEIVGVNLKRRHIFMGRWIRHGGRYPLRLLRLWRAGKGRVEDRWMDEHVQVWDGATLTFTHDFTDHNLNDLTFFTDKHNKYATREAIDIINQRRNLFPRDETLSTDNSSLQAAGKRWIKEQLYNRLPFPISSTCLFIYRYFLRLGFLDGVEGLIYHGLQGYWYRFLVGARTYELEKAIGPIHDREAALAELKRLTRLRLD